MNKKVYYLNKFGTEINTTSSDVVKSLIGDDWIQESPSAATTFEWPENSHHVDIETTSGFTLRIQRDGMCFVQDGAVSIGLGVFNQARAIIRERAQTGYLGE